MRLNKSERQFLATFMGIAQKLLNSPETVGKKSGNGIRRRRSRTDAVKLRKQIRAARKQKVPVKVIADQMGVSTAYIYQIGK